MRQTKHSFRYTNLHAKARQKRKCRPEQRSIGRQQCLVATAQQTIMHNTSLRFSWRGQPFNNKMQHQIITTRSLTL
eukprot:1880185-Amphidinium_carterae.1